jgi:hypothetical protein
MVARCSLSLRHAHQLGDVTEDPRMLCGCLVVVDALQFIHLFNPSNYSSVAFSFIHHL